LTVRIRSPSLQDGGLSFLRGPQVKTMEPDVTIRQETVVPIRAINTFDGTRIDLDNFAGLQCPPQPPPPLAPVGGRQDCHMTGVVSGRQLPVDARPRLAILPDGHW
jgi:hypothetical protein